MCRPVNPEVVKQVTEVLDRGATIISQPEPDGGFRVAVRDDTGQLGLGFGVTLDEAWQDCFKFLEDG